MKSVISIDFNSIDEVGVVISDKCWCKECGEPLLPSEINRFDGVCDGCNDHFCQEFELSEEFSVL